MFVDPENDPVDVRADRGEADVVLVGTLSPGDTTFEIRSHGVGSSLASVTATDGPDGPGRPARRDSTVTVSLAAPPLVDGFTLTLGEEDSSVTASWTELDSLWGATYELEARPGAGLDGADALAIYGVLEPPYVFSTPRPGTWGVRIRAVNEVGEGPWSEAREVIVPEPRKVMVGFAEGELVSQDPRMCPSRDHIGDRSGYITLSLDRAVDFEVRVDIVRESGPYGLIVITQTRDTLYQERAIFEPGVRTVKLEARSECFVAPGDVYVFRLVDPAASGPDHAGRAILAPGGGRFELTVDALPVVPALPFFGSVLLAIFLVARLRRSVRALR